MAQENTAPKRSLGARIINYFREARAELSRVTWSTRQEIIESTQVILVFAAVAMVVLGLIDTVFRFITVRLP
ncbi:MAG: preprotein translocase subunit SecE [Meiothermus sp.]|uniref:preprotein translocase subunit SecE n=1 Tax=Meiothermus sp. TaxID=1955249 RepID=UPI0025E1A21C|nr:preprotein translocase subunit SecE [Meiothermus sp.]MCS7057599.1 preprotein translocase subunit SecE [Meiothermus sp.]MCS7193951.1 preprotein translocase subunit SecE [Meiothermus sp.]MCX7740389.1 preprotein translocase subunit SecE [Meiothermus sp.]MDW8090763.1 preprotein translocase subunit SecE [Meiothermus sp.]MDW8480813.1 preprotein translocase subunit SecE [Meiothermus sp.]